MRVAAVSYLNTKPYVEGLQQVFSADELELLLAPPAACARAFWEGRADVALVPVGGLCGQPYVELMDDFCIGADGFVDSVFLFAKRPIQQLTHIWLDPHSRTSNGLVRILMAHHWQQQVTYDHCENYIDCIDDTAGGVIIGDRALAAKHVFPYCYDLAKEWKAFANLPFAFAVWAYRPEALGQEQLEKLHAAFEWGLNNRRTVAAKWASTFELWVDQAEDYLMRAISYRLDTRKKAALCRYITLLSELDGCPVPRVHIEGRKLNPHE